MVVGIPFLGTDSSGGICFAVELVKRFLDMQLRYSLFSYKFLYNRSGEQYMYTEAQLNAPYSCIQYVGYSTVQYSTVQYSIRCF